MSWTRICALNRLEPDRGVGALVAGRPVAVFLLTGGDLHVIAGRDPVAGANVLARGLVGSTGDSPYVASPLFKQRFDLRDGHCLDLPNLCVDVYNVRIVDGDVEVSNAPCTLSRMPAAAFG